MTNEILKQCTIEGNVVKLPEGQLERKLYQDVAKALELIGGKWKGKPVMGFVFKEDPTDLLAEIAGGEKRNLKKEYQFFETPAIVADLMVSKLGDVRLEYELLEPSAGQGALVDAFRRAHPHRCKLTLIEMMPLNCSILRKKGYDCDIIETDFLQFNAGKKYSRILANPPFAKNQDIDHIRKMYSLLAEGGTLVTLCSPHFIHSSGRKETDFDAWLDEIGASIEILPSGTFKESGTNIETVLLTINKV